MSDYSSLKVPDLKKLLQEKSLPSSGNKADLIARLQEHDKSQEPSKPAPELAATTADDEIDWDDDEPAPNTTTKPAEPAKPAEPTPAPATEQPAADAAAEPAKEAATVEEATATDAKTDEAPKQDFSANLAASTADEEARKREARAKRFGIVEEESEEAKKKAERAKRFGADEGTVVKGLDDALPERRERKRGREGGGDGERGAKRQSIDGRRGGGRFRGKDRRGGRGDGRQQNQNRQNGGEPKKIILDNPSEKAKAEARAKRFGA